MSTDSSRSTGSRASSDEQHNKKLMRAAIKLNTWMLAGVFGGVFGLSMLLMTYLSLFRGLPKTGQYLNLLGVFLPGYEVSHAGAWIGLFWGALIGAFLAAMLYRLYARGLGSQIERLQSADISSRKLTSVTMQFDGKYLGFALAAIVAGGLLVTTNWLVLRGTGDESVHAMLLANYLPGYSVSLVGSLIGAVELFAVTFVICLLFSWIYNAVVSLRSGDPQ
ncbi:MAG: hypothetical protein HKO55_02020 [Gammaproteobacteria bacterium]|nr:hypothetical protein [Gammaproteobacteria bacterium]